MTLSIILIAAGIICVLYGVTIMAASSGTPFFLVWYALGIVLGGAGALGVFLPDAPFARIVRLAVAACSAAGFVVTVAMSATIMSAARTAPPAGLDYLIVLGAQVKPDRTPANTLLFRLEAARDYLAANPSTKVVVTGGQGPNEPCPEADAMRDWLLGAGIAPERIQAERRATTTAENIALSLPLMDGARQVGVVTNDFHVYRALRIAERQGLAGAHGIAGRSLAWYLPNNLLRECLAIAKNLLLGTM